MWRRVASSGGDKSGANVSACACRGCVVAWSLFVDGENGVGVAFGGGDDDDDDDNVEFVEFGKVVEANDADDDDDDDDDCGGGGAN